MTAGQAGGGGIANTAIVAVSTLTPNKVYLTNGPSTNPGGGTVTFGTANALSLATNAASNLVLDGGTLQYSGTTVASTDRLFTIGQSSDSGAAIGTVDASGTSTNAVTFSNPGAVAFGLASQADTLVLTGTNTAANTMTPVIGNNGSAAVLLSRPARARGYWLAQHVFGRDGRQRRHPEGGRGVRRRRQRGVRQQLGGDAGERRRRGPGPQHVQHPIGSLAGGGATGGNVTLGAATLTTGGDNTSTAYAGASPAPAG